MFRPITFAASVLAVCVPHVSADTIMPTPTHHYPFDVDASDVTGGNDGLLVGGAIIIPDSRGMVLGLDGVDDYVALSSSNMPEGQTDSTVFTIAAWVKIPKGQVAPANMGGLYGEFERGHSKNFFLISDGDGVVSFDQYLPAGGGIHSSIAVTDNTWHHVVYVQNEPGSFRRKIYVDGDLYALDNSPERYAGLDPTMWAIGAYLGPGAALPYHTKGCFVSTGLAQNRGPAKQQSPHW